MKRPIVCVASVSVLVLAGSLLVSAQGAAPAPQGPPGQGGGRGAAPLPPPTNLQVLSKDMSAQQVVQVMQAFTQALGVTCAHCHVFVGPNDPMNDFAADTKPQKNVARAMMRLTQDVNGKLPGIVSKPADQVARVQCVTCHRGATIPAAPAAAPARGRGPAPGAPAAPADQPPGAGR